MGTKIQLFGLKIGSIAVSLVILLIWEFSISLGLVRSVILPASSEIGATLFFRII